MLYRWYFTIITDHDALRWLNNIKELTGRSARWAMKLQKFNYHLIHRKEKFRVVADALSQINNDE